MNERNGGDDGVCSMDDNPIRSIAHNIHGSSNSRCMASGKNDVSSKGSMCGSSSNPMDRNRMMNQ